MAVEWGSWSGPSGTRFRVGIDLSVSGTTITARYYLDSEGGVSDDQRLVMGYSIVGSVNYTASQPYNGGTQLIATRSVTSSRGVQRRFSARIEGVYNGASPRVDAYAMVPAAPPSSPGTPSVSSVSSTSTRITWSAPSSTNGASITRYQVQRADNSSFTSGAVTAFSSNRSYTNSSLSPNRTYYWRVRAENSAGWSGWSAGRAATTAPALPTAPTSLAVTRNSDTSQGVSWTRQATSQAPYASIQVERRDSVSPSWTRVATVGGTATSYTDTSTVASRRYDYRVRAVNGGGAGGYSATASVSTSPSAPIGVIAKKSSTQISVSWSKSTNQWGVYQHVIQDNPGGTGWVDVATVGDVSTWVHTSPDTNLTHQYRVASRVYTYGVGSAGLTGGWSASSNVVQLIAPPLAPSRRLPVGTIDRSAILTFAWTHNPVDTTEQAAYELQYRINGGAWTTLTGTTADYRSVSAPGVSGTLEWQVRTKGEHPDFGPWSPVWSASLASLPAVVLLAPGGILPSSRLTVEWSYANADGTGQAVWEAQLLDSEGALLETRAGSGGAVSAVFETALVDGTAYVARVRARSGAGMWSVWETVSFTTDFPQPVTVEPIPVWDQETGAVSLTFTDPPMPALYAWTGAEDASTSTKTTDAGTLTNFALNPSFETPGSTVEVARNYHPNPACVGTNGLTVWAGGPGNVVSSQDVAADWAVLGTARRFTWDTRANMSGTAGPVPASIAFPSTTSRRTVVWRFRASHAGQYTLTSTPGAVTYVATSGTVTVAAGGVGVMWVTYEPLTAGAYPEQLRTNMRDIPTGAGVWLEIADVDAYEGDYQQNRMVFNGEQSPDPDLTPSWVDAVNNSPTVLSAPRPANVLAAVAGQGQNYQTKNGREGKALRFVVHTQSSAGIPCAGTGVAVTGTLYTMVMWVRASRAITVHPRIRAATTGVDGVTLEPGVWTLVRTTVTAGSGGDSQTGLLLDGNSGHQIGDTVDVDDFTLVEGVHPDLMPFHGGYQSTTAIDTITVQRRINDGDWVTLAEDVQPDGAVTDPIPALAGTNTYRAVSKTTLPTSANGPNADYQINETKWHYINTGPHMSDVYRVHGNPNLSRQHTRNRATIHMAGRQNPITITGENRSSTYTLTAQLTPDATPPNEWENLEWTPDPICYRDPSGQRILGTVNGVELTGSKWPEVNVAFTKTDYQEEEIYEPNT